MSVYILIESVRLLCFTYFYIIFVSICDIGCQAAFISEILGVER